MTLVSRLFPWLVVLASAAFLGTKALAPRDAPGQMKLREFARIPVVYEGRIKPLDTLARNSLRILCGRQTFRDSDGRWQPAIKWLLDAITGADADHAVFRIENRDLLQTLGLEPRKGFRYARREFGPEPLLKVSQQAERASRRETSDRDVYDNQVLAFFLNKHVLHRRLVAANQFPVIQTQEQLIRITQEYRFIDQFSLPHLVPPEMPGGKWRPLVIAAIEAATTGQTHPASEAVTAMFGAYERGDVAAFNHAVDEHRVLLDKIAPGDLRMAKIRFEYFFNHLSPFYHCAVLYLIVFLMVCVGWLVWPTALNRAAFFLVVFTLVVHTFALVARIYISGRPPVTNLYSSAVFIGWGCVAIGLIFEMIYRLGVGTLVAAVAGFSTLLIAHFLAGDGDTFRVLQAVLDTQFWLSTHVVCVTLGYATTYLAGLLGILYVLRGVFSPSGSPAVSRDMAGMIYGAVCFAVFFSFVGTVLGGLWADDSWGRFWGWDPKENGALIIVLWNVLILHARWGGMVAKRGLALLAIFGNVVTTWSWFGVNLLGVGLHSYGFVDSTAFWLVLFVLSQLLIVMVGVLPIRRWISMLTA